MYYSRAVLPLSLFTAALTLLPTPATITAQEYVVTSKEQTPEEAYAKHLAWHDRHAPKNSMLEIALYSQTTTYPVRVETVTPRPSIIKKQRTTAACTARRKITARYRALLGRVITHQKLAFNDATFSKVLTQHPYRDSQLHNCIAKEIDDVFFTNVVAHLLPYTCPDETANLPGDDYFLHAFVRQAKKLNVPPLVFLPR